MHTATQHDSSLATLLTAAGHRVSQQRLPENDTAEPAEVELASTDLLVLPPDVASIAFLQQLRTRYSYSELPVLYLSAGNSTQQRNLAIAAGANDYIDLPIEPEILKLRVCNLLSVKLASEQNRYTQQGLQQEVEARTAKLNMLIENGLMLTAERDRNQLLRHILLQGQRLLHCDAGTLYLVTDENMLRFALRSKEDVLPNQQIPLYDQHGSPNVSHVSTYSAIYNVPVVIDDVYAETRFDLSGTRAFDAATSYRTLSMLCIPMSPRDGEAIGVLQFMNAMDAETGEIVPFCADNIALVVALASQAAMALDNLQLVEAQAKLMESMIRVIATAIDAKSPYTGRHCERVPELALMLAEAACDCKEGALAEFNFSTDQEWQEFRIGAWLHDCGKMTTPEYVIDKATKLETIYNRIHEIRLRFEVLLRDADIERLQQRLDGTADAEADRLYSMRLATLQDDFAFLAECNLGSEAMDAAKIARVQQLAQLKWQRNFDDRLGLSFEESERAAAEPGRPLPVTEQLLADKPLHIIKRKSEQALDPAFGFQMDVPGHLYNYGEVYNLCITRGTLTKEERYKINEHMIQGIMMLERMNFPKSLRRVPEYAGTHHETLDGSGYPRKLNASQLSIPARIMAIVDIFEALTASDRPYKKPKPMSEALSILHGMKMSGRIDGVLFDLFLTSGIYLRYADKYLHADQMDEVDIERLLGSASLPNPEQTLA